MPKNITYTTVELGGSVTDEGGGAVSESGFVVGINVSPTITDLKFPVTKGKTAIALIVSKLNVNTKYYVRSYAINEKGIAYGNEQSFTTDDYKLPSVTTDKAVDITHNSAVLNGLVTSEGGLIVSQRGFCFGINPNPTILENKVISGEGLGSFKINLEQLKNNFKYYVRSYAINSKGIGYGNEQSFTTLELPVKPRVNTAIVEVKSKTGRIWMDRNLGATRAAISSKDTLAIGDLYQWGRLSDGHELRTSAIEESFYTNSTLSITDVPGHAIFIRNENQYWRQDWRLTQNDNLWQGVNGINNPCPNGYRLPTIIEWKQETESWNGGVSPLFFTSPLKLPIGGYRKNDGMFNSVSKIYNSLYNDSGAYWSSTVGGINAQYYITGGSFGYLPRAFGLSVRCIKD